MERSKNKKHTLEKRLFGFFFTGIVGRLTFHIMHYCMQYVCSIAWIQLTSTWFLLVFLIFGRVLCFFNSDYAHTKTEKVNSISPMVICAHTSTINWHFWEILLKFRKFLYKIIIMSQICLHLVVNCVNIKFTDSVFCVHASP